jgi:hypothetical protein
MHAPSSEPSPPRTHDPAGTACPAGDTTRNAVIDAFVAAHIKQERPFMSTEPSQPTPIHPHPHIRTHTRTHARTHTRTHTSTHTLTHTPTTTSPQSNTPQGTTYLDELGEYTAVLGPGQLHGFWGGCHLHRLRPRPGPQGRQEKDGDAHGTKGGAWTFARPSTDAGSRDSTSATAHRSTSAHLNTQKAIKNGERVQMTTHHCLARAANCCLCWDRRRPLPTRPPQLSPRFQ